MSGLRCGSKPIAKVALLALQAAGRPLRGFPTWGIHLVVAWEAIGTKGEVIPGFFCLHLFAISLARSR